MLLPKRQRALATTRGPSRRVQAATHPSLRARASPTGRAEAVPGTADVQQRRGTSTMPSTWTDSRLRTRRIRGPAAASSTRQHNGCHRRHQPWPRPRSLLGNVLVQGSAAPGWPTRSSLYTPACSRRPRRCAISPVRGPTSCRLSAASAMRPCVPLRRKPAHPRSALANWRPVRAAPNGARLASVTPAAVVAMPVSWTPWHSPLGPPEARQPRARGGLKM